MSTATALIGSTKFTTRYAADDASVDIMRADFKRHRDACVAAVGKDAYLAALAEAVARCGFKRSAMNPAKWVEAVESIVLPCPKCNATGVYVARGSRRDGCYGCNGSGKQELDDVHRNRVYLRHAIRAAAGF